MSLPDQTIPESRKDKNWGIECIRHGLLILDSKSERSARLNKNYRSYNGERSQDSIAWLTKIYGLETRTEFKSYRAGRTKQNLLDGEWLRRPMKVTVETTNISAVTEKMQQADLLYGAMLAKQELLALKEETGLDVMEGVPIPDSEDDPLWQKFSPKDKQEIIMQVIANEQVKTLHLKRKFAQNFLDARIAGECFGKVVIDSRGRVHYKWVDPRDSVFEEIPGDDFIEQSSIVGAREWVPLHEVLTSYFLEKKDREFLEQVSRSPGEYYNHATYRFRNESGQCMVEVVHVEWKSVRPSYYKVMKKTPRQLEFDSSTDTIMDEVSPEVYEKHKKKYDKGEQDGKWTIEVRYDEDLWEGTSLGRAVFTNVRRKEFQLRPHDDPSRILGFSYVGCLFNTVDGRRISVQEQIEPFDLQFDVCEYQIMKELNKAKGKILSYDLAAIPKGKDLVKLIQEATDDGFITYNSMAAGNVGNRNLELQKMFQEFDLGFSESFPQLLALQNQILQVMDRIVGIPEARSGAIQASATVANTQQSIQNSQAQTEALFFMMGLFVEKVMHRIVEATKISWAFYRREEGEHILGTEKFKYLQVTSELGYRDYGVHYEDGSRYERLRQRLGQFMEFGMNAKQISMADIAKFELAESAIESVRIFENTQQRLEQIAQQQHQEDLATRERMNAQMAQTQYQIAAETREDLQSHDLEMVGAKARAQIMVDDNKADGKLMEKSIQQPRR